MRQWGDFQTPPALVDAVLATVWNRFEWSRVLEPTCGIGNFLVAACAKSAQGRKIELKGFEIQEQHCAEAARQLRAVNCAAEIVHRSIFDVNLANLDWATDGPILVVGNPPWATNAELGAMGSANLPAKSNFKGMAGYAAQTGAANFDIAEYILLKVIRELGGYSGTIALLCKRVVARNALEFASHARLRIANAAIYRIDAGAWFGAAVDACLFVCDIGVAQPCYEADSYDALGDDAAATRMHVVAGHLVEDAAAYASVAEIDSECPVQWRQGIKHDVAGVAELRRSDDGSVVNGAGEVVDVEANWLYPLLKSSDVFHRRLPARRYAIVTQRTLKDDPAEIAKSSPRLWQYLQRHREAFERRKSIIYRKRPPFSMFGIGPYTFAPYKVAVSGMYTPPRFVAIGLEGNRPILFDDTCYFLPFQAAVEAAVVAAILQSDVVQSFLAAVATRGGKRPITKKVLQRIDLAKVIALKSAEGLYKHASDEYRQLTGVELSMRELKDCLERLTAAWSRRHEPTLFAS